MEIRGPLPFHVAKAYGAVAPPATPVSSAKLSAASAQRLVAGTVSVPADPALASNAPHATARSADSFPLYTRAADRVEVATAVALGRNVDRTV